MGAVGGGEQAADRPGPARVAGLDGDLAVGHDLAGRQPVEHVDDGRLERVPRRPWHPTILPGRMRAMVDAAEDHPVRIPPLAPDQRDERTEALLATLRGPGSEGDLNIFATLAHHPKLLKRWSAFGGVLLYGGELPARERELLILRTAWNCRADYEWGQHVRIGLAAGVTSDEIAALAGAPAATRLVAGGRRPRAGRRRAPHRRPHRRRHVGRARRPWSEAQLIELCMVVGPVPPRRVHAEQPRRAARGGVEGLPGVSHAGRLDGRRILVVGAGTRPSAEPDAPVGNGGPSPWRPGARAPRSSAPTSTRRGRDDRRAGAGRGRPPPRRWWATSPMRRRASGRRRGGRGARWARRPGGERRHRRRAWACRHLAAEQWDRSSP